MTMPIHNKDFIDSLHTVQTTAADGRDLLFFTGTIVLDSGPNGIFNRMELDPDGWRCAIIETNFGPPWESLDNVAPAAALASILSSGLSPGSELTHGWAVDDCNWEVNLRRQIKLKTVVAVFDGGVGEHSTLFRVAFQATAIGVLSPQ